jgi:hypothetical protein
MGGSRSGEIRIRRFLNNPKVTPAEMFATAVAHTLTRVQERHILVIQDTTSLRDDGRKKSLQLHPAIAIEAGSGALLGLVYATLLRRDGTPQPHCNKRPLAEKESRRWVDVLTEAGRVRAAGAARVTAIGDCENDLYEAFACSPEGVDVLVRAHHDRVLAAEPPPPRRKGRGRGGAAASSPPTPPPVRLFTCLDEVPELGRETIVLPASSTRAQRTVTLALRARRVSIQRPKRNHPAAAAQLPPSVSLSFVEAREVDPPPGVEPVHWRLLTTHRVETLADAQRITGYYRERWTIEQLFRVMKTQGFNIEAVRMQAEAAFENLAAATLIAAIAVQQMLRDRDGQAQRPAEDLFDPAEQPAIQAICHSLEGKTPRQKNPHPRGSLASVTWLCARLGGWTGYYGKPGPIVLLRGYQRLRTMLQAWQIALHDPGRDV